jgi:pyruvate formate lyase activating enzyme
VQEITNVLITNIQRTSFHDGPGIRTTVFFKGCTLHCPWCANPETINSEPEWYYDESRCLKVNQTCICNNACPILSRRSFEHGAYCPVAAISVFGKEIDESALFNEIIKDKTYWRTTGGVTFSGGEPLLQLHSQIKLLQKLKNHSIHIAVESALFVPQLFIDPVIPYIDSFYIDIKILDPQQCKVVLGGDSTLFTNNVAVINSYKKDCIYRIPLVPGITATKKNFTAIAEIIQKYPPRKVEYFFLHTMAEKKYTLLCRAPYIVPSGTISDFEIITDTCRKLHISCDLLKV